MQKIYKYLFPISDEQQLYLPKDAQILTCFSQARVGPVLYAIVDSEAPTVPRNISCRGTGHPMHGKEGKYVGTIRVSDDTLIFHVFDGGEHDS